jgi:tripartite-type tricarboxylate transporter receptor subunit TctC
MTVNLPLVKAGKARSLGISSLERNPMVPDMIPLKDQGAKGFEYDAWSGIVAPKAVPMPIIRKLNAEFVKAGNTPDVLRRLAPSGQTRGGSSIEEYQAKLVRETERWKTLAKDAKLQLQDVGD